jgi:hypothetical protein
MTKKILLTGGTGFLGSYILAALVQRGYDVYALRRGSTSPHWIDAALLEKVQWISGDVLDIVGLEEAMEDMANDLTDGGQNVASLGDKFKIMGAGMKSAFSGLGKNLLGPEALITEMVSALQKADEATGKLAKDFNLTYSEALDTRRELSNMATMSGDVALNAGALQESMVAVGQSLGTNAKLNDADLKTFTKLREQAGYTNEELIGIQKLSLVNGKTLEDNTKEILGGAEAYATRNGFVVNEKEYILDFLQNCDRNSFVKLKEHTIKLREDAQLKPLAVKCIHCEHEYNQTIALNVSDFFE